ncbi:T9SS type A sorting domain-containing protein [Hymenobacter sp. 15J16-1T3B]|uniref:CARDB domain-containing protein n=1 Tax=Hymenobacter sp. 15J16-1T3B TaxID=2886941 RepID=UPI001D1089DF|nr:CARDB domain-containing protein [Hymenobacter sp. 15J16-1T3B]MCC3157714.1 T9SS type A sorting domain-containing protein [Hymenobacter sp. 15J16-1T3B]
MKKPYFSGYGRKIQLLFLLVMSWLGLQQAAAQTYTMPVTGSNTITTCAGTLYDNGGASGPYVGNTGTLTIMPATTGNKVQLNFTSVSIDYYDYLTIYDGTSTSAPVIGTYYGSTSIGTVYGTSSSGAITLRLTGSNYYSYAGFSASIACVTSVPQPDLAVQGASAYPLSAVAGSYLSLSCSIYNLSGTTATSSNVGYYLSTDNTLSTSDQLLGYSSGYSLAVGGSSTRSSSVQIPTTVTPGSYYLLFVGDYDNLVSESNENNNIASVSFTVSAPSYDLIIQTPSATPTAVAQGGTLSLSCYISNTGNATAASSSVGYYLSSNTTLDATDVLLTSTYGGSLSPSSFGASRYGYTNIPATTPTGSYYVLFVADYQDLVTETNETNNVASVAITVSPPGVDLAIQQAQLGSSSTLAGSSIYASAYLYNLGNMNATASRVGYYLSTNTTFDASDVLLSSTSMSSLTAGQYYSLYPTLTIPSTTTTGSYYVLFVADDQGQVTETNETNNVASVALSVTQPNVDLQIQQATLSPNTTSAGGSVYASCSIYNAGTTAASYSYVGYYLSTNTTLDASDTYLNYAYGSTLSGGFSSTRAMTLSIPASTASGSYYILFVADYSAQVGETNETNNVASAALTITAPSVDLQIQQATLSPTSTTAGGTVYTSCSIYNAGTTTAASSYVGYYLSTDNTLSTSDTYLNYTYGSTLSGGFSSSRTGSVYIPSGTAAGNYYILFVADYAAQVSETNETNNVAAVALTVTPPSPDLTVSSFYPSSYYLNSGASTTVSAYVYNQGLASAASSNAGVYLSTDMSFSTSDVLLASSTGGALASGSSSYRTATVTIPAATTTGYYYLLFVADNQGQVTESDETNNVSYYSIYVTNVAPVNGTLVPASGSASITSCSTTIYDNGGNGNYADNSEGTLTINPGTTGSKVRLTFNTFVLETCCDYVSIYDGTSTSAPLLGTYVYSPGVVTASSTNTSGALTVRFHSDGSGTYAGFDATVSCVTTALPDLTLTQVVATPTTVMAGNSTSVSLSVNNVGVGAASSTPVAYYLSADNTLDAADRLLGNVTGASLNASTSVTRTNVVTIPTTTTAGNYYLICAADINNVVAESSESNNIATAVAITVTGAAADLVVSSPTLTPTTVMAGNNVTATCFHENTGLVSAGAHTLGFYLSTDNQFSSNDVLLNSISIASMPAGSGLTRVATCTIPAATAAGNYYVLYVADSQGQITEGSETNNVVSQAVTVTVNTAAREQTAGFAISLHPNPTATGQPFLVSFEGNGSAAAAHLALYNSLGQLVSQQQVTLRGNAAPVSIQTAGLARGVYTLRISGEKLNATRQVIID